MALTEEEVYDAIVRHGGVKQAAPHLGLSRQRLYQRFPDAIRRAQSARARKAREGSPRIVHVRLPAALVPQLDALAAGAGKNRAGYVLDALATLPRKLPAPHPGAWNGSGNKGQAVYLKVHARVWERLEATGAPAGVLRALLMGLAAATP